MRKTSWTAVCAISLPRELESVFCGFGVTKQAIFCVSWRCKTVLLYEWAIAIALLAGCKARAFRHVMIVI